MHNLLLVLTYLNVHIHPAVDLRQYIRHKPNITLLYCVNIKQLMNPKKESDNVARILFLHYLNDGRLKMIFVTKCSFSVEKSQWI